MMKHDDNEVTIRTLQGRLKERGHYAGTVDGWGGGKTRAALDKALPPLSKPPATEPPAEEALGAASRVDARSEGNIITLLPEVQNVAREFLWLANDALPPDTAVRIISGTRTWEEQDRIYRQAFDKVDNDGDGRVDEADERVTKAPAGYSNHNFGLAFDIGIFRGARYLESGNDYVTVAKIGEGLGLEWGGRWKSFPDRPHYQLRPAWAKGLRESEMLAELRRRHQQGKGFFA